MTHDELLALVTPTLTYSPWARIKNPNKLMKAIRAVVELHKPDSLNECVRCSNDFINADYPCFTIQIIEEQLK